MARSAKPKNSTFDYLLELQKDGIQVQGLPMKDEYAQILTADALRFVAKLAQNFEPTRKLLLRERERRQKEINLGKFPDFLEETREIRDSSWKVAPIPNDLQDRRVEITGPVSRKMVINALNSGAKVFMADFEDANSPTWENNVDGQFNLRDAVNRTISITVTDKVYKLNEKTAVLMVRPRGWHLVEQHVTIWGEPISASIFDFGLYFFHNAKTLLENGSGPYYYLPKMESHHEAGLWAKIFQFSEDTLKVKRGSIRATVLIETILAAFEMDEILYELKDYSAGLNCGRWDYIFSFIKKFYAHKQFVVPDRSQVGMTQPFMNAYVQLLIKTCHRRGIHAMGGMAAQIPSRDPDVNRQAFEKVKADKLREVKAGHDGTWVAHPGMVQIALDIFNEHMKNPNQLEKIPDVHVTAKTMLEIPQGTRTLEGLQGNLRVGILYIEAWLRGEGAVGINNLMEDLATAEIARGQVQQWLRHSVSLADGTVVNRQVVQKLFADELAAIKKINKNKSVDLAAEIFRKIFFDRPIEEFGDFMSLDAYPYIVSVPRISSPKL